MFAFFGGLLVLAGIEARSVAAPENKGNADEPLRLDVTVTAGDAANKDGDIVKVQRGQTVRITVRGTPRAGYHSYPITVPAGEPQAEASKVTFGAVKGVEQAGDIVESPPAHLMSNGELIWAFEMPFTWQQEFRINDEAAAGVVELPIKVTAKVCNEKNCIDVATEVRAKFEVSPGAPAGPKAVVPPAAKVEPAPKEAGAEKQPGGAKAPGAKKTFTEAPVGLISVGPDEYKARMEKLTEQLVKQAPPPDTGLWAFILAGMFWGGISLITPCVFPMIPITVSYFLKQAEKEHHRPVAMASVYSLTIVVVLTLAAAFLLDVFRWLSINPLMNYGLGALFIFFALSLFGMYEIELPSGLARFTSAREGKGGYVGTIFMALTFTIISFACVAPFLGGFAGTAAAARPLTHNLLGGFAFAATFAAPFFVLAMFPTLLKALPKSGAWLNSVKVVMGFLELAAAFKFFRGAELIQFGGEARFFTYDLVLGVWIALAFLCGMYLIGMFRLPHDTPAENIGVPRLLFSATFLGVGLYLTPALFKVNSDGTSQRPGGVVYAWVDAFLLPESRSGGGSASRGHPIIGDLHYAVEKSREHLRITGQPKRILVDFTGIICSNCRYNERDVFPQPDVQRALEQYLYVELYADGMPVELYAPEIRGLVAKDDERRESDKEANVAFQLKVVDEITLPTYVILEPRDNKILVVDIYSVGRIGNVPDFMQFLTGARAKEKEQLAQN